MNERNNDNTHTHVILTKGTMVSHYRIVEKIGAGGMGEVYLAEDTKLDRKVALKFLPPNMAQDPDVRLRFTREAQATAKLNHPNIVTMYEVSEQLGRPFFAMELVEGQSLSELSKSSKLGVDRIIEIAIQVCDGLGAAHEKEIVHRDIKPSNIVIDAYGRPKILDFGLAAIKGGENLTKTGSTLGTIRYMSPEQVQGNEIDRRSDLYSLGVVLYELLAGRTPFERDNEAATLKSITADNPEPLARYKADIPEELQRTVSKLLEKDPSFRYQSASGIMSDLKRIDAASGRASTGKEEKCDRRKMLAVLPFQNLGPSEEEYFADGITEEIISRLSAIRNLGVISRTSAMKYKHTTQTIREIGAALGVDYVLEGSVRWARTGGEAGRVRITPRLVRVSDDTHLWSDRYDRVLDDIFDIQSEIAEHVVEELNIQLHGTERDMLQLIPTENLEAYQYYLQGLEFAGRPDYAEGDFQRAEEVFTRAVNLDPEFALAYAELSRTHSLVYFHGYDRSSDRIGKAKSAVEIACSLKPESTEVHLALGYFHYYCKLDYELAYKELNKVKQQRPNDSRVLALTGAIVKRQGKITEAIDYYRRAFEISPRDASLLHEIGCAYMTLRNYSEAQRYYDLSIALSEDQVSVFVCKARNHYLWQGNVLEGQKTLSAISGVEKRDSFELYYSHLLDRDYELALKMLMSAPEVYEVGQWSFIPKALFEGYALMRIGRQEDAEGRYEAALELLESEVSKRPEDDRVHASLGNVYAGLGNREAAIREAKLAVELNPISRNAVVGPFRVEDLAFTYTLLGMQEDAIDQLKYLLSIPCWMSEQLLRIDPRWDSLRDHPRYQAMIEEYDAE